VKGKFVDLTGRKFGRWVVIEQVENRGIYCCWLCRCDCGVEKKVTSRALLSGDSTSCGCYQRETCGKINRLENGLSAKKSIYENYKRQAKKKEVVFDLNFEEFLELTQRSCYYCGKEPENFYKPVASSGGFKYSGIDRIDNTKGYTKGNCVSCCKRCNIFKSDMSYEEFIKHASRIISYKNTDLHNFLINI